MSRLYLYGIAVAVVLALLGGAVLKIRHDEAQKWRGRVEAAQAQAKVDQATTKALDTYVTRTVVIREKADHAVSTVQSAPGADQPLDPVRRDALCAALASVRGSPVCVAGPAEDHDPGKPAGAVSGSDEQP